MQPLRVLGQRLARRAEIWRVLRRARRRFAGDPRFHLDFAEQGLAPRLAEPVDDSALLGRICDAWSLAMARQPTAAAAFQPHRWWSAMERVSLEPVRRALAARDIASLGRMYRNFFRDPCSRGLTGLPLARIEAGQPPDNISKELHLADALHRVNLWTSRTAGRFPIADLGTPNIGNPFGVMVDGVFVRSGCEDQHSSAHRIIDLFDHAAAPAVAEIGGGFGGMACYLLRDRPGVTYLDFDLPDSIALASYYLLSAFPDAKSTLYGEAELGAETLRTSRIILMPAFAMPQLPARSIDVAFNSRILSDLEPASLSRYLTEIERTTRSAFLHLNRIEGSLATDAWLSRNAPDFRLIEKRPSEWNDARTLRANEIEYLYARASSERGGGAGLISPLIRPVVRHRGF